MMIPDTRQRLESALQELHSTVVCGSTRAVIDLQHFASLCSRCRQPPAPVAYRYASDGERACYWLKTSHVSVCIHPQRKLTCAGGVSRDGGRHRGAGSGAGSRAASASAARDC